MIYVCDFVYDLCDFCAIVHEMQTTKQQWKQKKKSLSPTNRD